MKNAGLSVDLAGLHFGNPTMLASGILGYSAQTFESVVKGGAGGVVTKSVCLTPRKGYANPTVVQAECGLINAIGLPNPGIEDFADEIRRAKCVLKVPVIVSVFGFSAEEYAAVARRATSAGADGLELNVSCPHVKDTGSEIGQNPKLLGDVVRAVKASTDRPILVKLSPNVTSIVDSARIAEDAGADAVTVMNTVKAMAIDVETTLPILANRVGGLSGPAVKPIALRHVFDVYEKVDIPIVGCGGISSWRDAVEFLLAGASAVQVGTAIAVEGPTVFLNITRGIKTHLRRKNVGHVKEIVGLSHRN
jgi:dihydroorotate dehydrogenase (NAD+) catalytic subunit